MVDMYMEVEQARSMTMMGTLKLGLPANERMAAVSAAKAKVARGANFVGQNAIQTHGGIGITQELAIGHYFKRATMTESQFGSADLHMDSYERLTLADGLLLPVATRREEERSVGKECVDAWRYRGETEQKQ